MTTAPTMGITAYLASGDLIEWSELEQALNIQKSMRQLLLKKLQDVTGAQLPTSAKGPRICTATLRDLMVAARGRTAGDKSLSFEAAVRLLLIEQGFDVPPSPATLDELNATVASFQQTYAQHLESLITRLNWLESTQNQSTSRIAELECFQVRVEALIAEEETSQVTNLAEAAELTTEQTPEETFESLHPAAKVLGWIIAILEWVRYGVQWLVDWTVRISSRLFGGWRRS